MRIAAFLIAVVVGVGCCVISLVDARVQQPGLISAADATALETQDQLPAHIMRGWRHGGLGLPADAEAATTAK